MTGISTKNISEKPEDKKEKIKKLREYHQPVLDALKLSDATFIPKMAYKPHGKTELFIACFESEINKGVDVYTEFASKDFVPETADRGLWKWKFNPHFEEEYEKTEPNPITGHCRFLIPVGELQRIEMPVIKEKTVTPVQTELVLELNDPNDDLPIDQLTIRDLAAILWQKPVSHKDFLNKLITNK